jgi:hypothetical protein
VKRKKKRKEKRHSAPLIIFRIAINEESFSESCTSFFQLCEPLCARMGAWGHYLWVWASDCINSTIEELESIFSAKNLNFGLKYKSTLIKNN